VDTADVARVAKAIDWTPSFKNPLLPADDEFEYWCGEASKRGIGQLFVPPLFLEKAKEGLKNSGVRIFTALEAAYMGQNNLSIKMAMLPELIRLGAQEIDTLMNFHAFKSGRFSQVESEILAITSRARELKKDIKVKIIVETGLWSEPELRDAAKVIQQGGADFIKTCLGTGPRGVSERDVELLYRTVGDRIGIKASGGIKTGAQALRFLQLGATRLGISQALSVLDSL
jgi:deoxyribose-phosphate aldolase